MVLDLLNAFYLLSQAGHLASHKNLAPQNGYILGNKVQSFQEERKKTKQNHFWSALTVILAKDNANQV